MSVCGGLPLRSRKASLKDKVFPSPSKAPVAKGKAPQSPGPEDGAEASPNKVAKSWSFSEKNRGPKPAFRARGNASRQNSDGKTEARTGSCFLLVRSRTGLCVFTQVVDDDGYKLISQRIGVDAAFVPVACEQGKQHREARASLQ